LQAPWDLDSRVERARVEVLAIRWAVMQHKAKRPARLAQQAFEAAFQNNPLFEREYGAASKDAARML
jgi:hypothetical protein